MEQTFLPHRIVVVHKPDHEAATMLAREMAQWFAVRGCQCGVQAGSGGDILRERPELVVVLGGDGTMLGVARKLAAAPGPLVGVNFGKVGFLAELHVGNWQEGLSCILEGHCRLLRRLALRWAVLREGARLHEGLVVNDVVLSRGALSRVISLNISADSRHICRVRADGLILSTPTGSSGYAVSAGGPLVHPELQALTITPICPFLCNFPPMVLPMPMRVSVEVMSDAVETFLTLDGQESVALAPGDVVEVSGEPDRVFYARIGEATYFRRLKARGFIEEYAGPPLQGV